jgi:membrane-associated phospholipid phosphatase
MRLTGGRFLAIAGARGGLGLGYLVGLLLALNATAAFGQDAKPGFTADGRLNVPTSHAIAVTAGVTALFLIDRPVRNFLQAHRSRYLDGLASVFKKAGTPPVYGLVGGGMLGLGLIADNDKLKRAAGRLILSEVVTFIGTEITKKVFGRARPDSSPSPFNFNPFNNRQESFVSGHAAIAFTIATSLSADIDNTWARVALYTFAAGTAWSRLNDNKHWPSDVVGGSVLGITVAKIIGDRWEILDITPPHFLREPSTAVP